MLQKLLGTSNSFAPLFMRLALGAFMLPHGLQKTIGCFEGKGFSTTLNDFQASGMPLPVAVLVILGESLGALGLIFGCITR